MKTYQQKWHEYNLSQTSEKLMFMNILNELCRYIDVEDKKKRGRPRLNLKEIIYCMCLLTYSEKSSRRVISELHMSKDRNFISKVPHFNSVLNYFNDKQIKKHLQFLITLSSTPLKYVEQDFTVDSSGFTTSVFGRWLHYRFGKNNEYRVWRKAHVMSGVKTNIITSVEVDKGTSHDGNMFPELVERTSHNFNMKEVSADMAYSSRANVLIASKKGAVPYIPFKKHSSGKADGTMVWSKMFIYFQTHHEEFMKHYHKRSNAESVFSMIKRKFGMHLRCKNEVAQDNELLCKCLCHNIVVLIHEIFELDITVEFEEQIKTLNFCADYSPAQKLSI